MCAYLWHRLQQELTDRMGIMTNHGQTMNSRGQLHLRGTGPQAHYFSTLYRQAYFCVQIVCVRPS